MIRPNMRIEVLASAFLLNLVDPSYSSYSRRRLGRGNRPSWSGHEFQNPMMALFTAPDIAF